MGLCRICDYGCQCGFSNPWRSPEYNGGEKPVGFNGTTKQPPRADNIILTNELIKGARADACCQGGFLMYLILTTVFKKLHIAL